MFGVTFMVLAPEHPLVERLTTPERREEVLAYVERAKGTSEIDRLSLEREKTGVFTGSYAVNPLNGERVQLWVADYVLGTYGTGVVMGVPAHDTRDFAFARHYGIPVKMVIAPPGGKGGRGDGGSPCRTPTWGPARWSTPAPSTAPSPPGTGRSCLHRSARSGAGLGLRPGPDGGQGGQRPRDGETGSAPSAPGWSRRVWAGARSTTACGTG